MTDDNPYWRAERRRRRWRIALYVLAIIVLLPIVVVAWLVLRGDGHDQRKLSRRSG